MVNPVSRVFPALARYPGRHEYVAAVPVRTGLLLAKGSNRPVAGGLLLSNGPIRPAAAICDAKQCRHHKDLPCHSRGLFRRPVLSPLARRKRPLGLRTLINPGKTRPQARASKIAANPARAGNDPLTRLALHAADRPSLFSVPNNAVIPIAGGRRSSHPFRTGAHDWSPHNVEDVGPCTYRSLGESKLASYSAATRRRSALSTTIGVSQSWRTGGAPQRFVTIATQSDV
jgi:hypothetical protein